MPDGSPDVTCKKWNGTAWGVNPQPIIEYNGPEWGKGQPCFVVKDDILFIYYTDGGTKVVTVDATNENWPALIDETEAITIFTNDSARATYGGKPGPFEVKYIDSLNKFIGIGVSNEFKLEETTDNYIFVCESVDGTIFYPVATSKNYWGSLVLGDGGDGGAHNIGMSGDKDGHLDLNGTNFVAYGYGLSQTIIDQPYKGRWPTYLNKIVVQDICPVEAAFSADKTTGEAPLPVVFTDQSTGTITSWEWDFNNDSTIDSTDTNPIFIYSAPGTYSISLTVTGPGGSDTETKIDYITVNTPADTVSPTVKITQPTSDSTYETQNNILNIAGTAWDNVAVTEVTWSNNQGETGTCTGTESWSADGIVLYEGENVITVTAHDAAGNPPGDNTLTVTYIPQEGPEISLSLASLINACWQNQNAYNQGFEVWNSGSGTLNYTIDTDASWLSCDPLSGASTGEHDAIKVTYTNKGLAPGEHYATITISDPEASNSPQTIAVSLTVVTGRQGAPLPDTGQTTSYTGTFGEDSDYSINPPSYTKLDASGNDLPDSAAEWVMVRDNVTGLIWEVKTDDESIHDKDNQYTWYDSNPQTNCGEAGTQGDGTDTEDFINALNSSEFGGYSDWRLPTIKELSSIVDLGCYGPAVDADYFLNTQLLPRYWSSTTRASDNSGAWDISFGYGIIAYSPKYSIRYVRAVRGRQAADSAFINNGDGTITDSSTGLMWQQETGAIMNWEDAITQCETNILAGYDDWRLPNRRELRSIVKFESYEPAIDIDHFPNTGSSSYYWSSSACTYDTDSAWYINFESGLIYYEYKPSGYYVRAVRGGQNRLLDHLFITMPSQGSSWNGMRQMPIRWETQGISGNVKISISRQGGKEGTFEIIIASTPNTGSYDWTVTGKASVNCVLKIEPLLDPTKGTIQGLFAIVASKAMPWIPLLLFGN